MLKTLSIGIAPLLLSGILWAIPVPQTHEHPREKPTTFCYHTAPKGKVPCQCLKQDDGRGCREGHRQTEVNTCSSYCWMDMCACCKS